MDNENREVTHYCVFNAYIPLMHKHRYEHIHYQIKY